MEFVEDDGNKTLRLRGADELELIRAAASIRANGIHWFEIAQKPLQAELWRLANRMDLESVRVGKSREGESVSLTPAEFDLTIGAMRWAIAHNDFDPQGTTGEIRQALQSIDSDPSVAA